VFILQQEKLQIYNSYFESHNVDFIVIPGQYCDAITYHDAANSTLQLNTKIIDSNGKEEYQLMNGSLDQCNTLTYFTMKDIPVPKLWIPVGLDPDGRPVSVGLLGKGPPVDKLWDDEYAKVHDIEFLQKAKRIVDVLASTTDLSRVDAPIAPTFDEQCNAS
jgi:hypothetical protein